MQPSRSRCTVTGCSSISHGSAQRLECFHIADRDPGAGARDDPRGPLGLSLGLAAGLGPGAGLITTSSAGGDVVMITGSAVPVPESAFVG